jgi:hypothetical protein
MSRNSGQAGRSITVGHGGVDDRAAWLATGARVIPVRKAGKLLVHVLIDSFTDTTGSTPKALD